MRGDADAGWIVYLLPRENGVRPEDQAGLENEAAQVEIKDRQIAQVVPEVVGAEDVELLSRGLVDLDLHSLIQLALKSLDRVNIGIGAIDEDPI